MFNVVILTGRLTADPELKTTQSGISVTSFAVAVDRRFNRQGEERQADFIDVVAWRQSADFVCKYFRKGSMIAIQGSIQTRMAVEIVADNVSFCGSKAEGGAGSFARDDSYAAAQPAPSYSTAHEGDFKEIPEDDLPF